MSSENNLNHLSDHLTEEYGRQKSLFSIQPDPTQRSFEVQGKQLAEALLENRSQVHFNIPDRVVCLLENVAEPVLVTIPHDQCNYKVGNVISRLRKEQLYKQLRHVLTGLEQSPDRSISVAAGLLRYATVMDMVNNKLPSGNEVQDQTAGGGEVIQSIPGNDRSEISSMATASSAGFVKNGELENKQEARLVGFTPYAQMFYMPEWVAFGEKGELLVTSLEEAIAHNLSMQSFMEVLFKAVALAHYISADPEYTKKRYGMLRQLVNQGRALAVYQTKEIIVHIKERAEAGNLNRGLRLSMPYFDDQDLKLYHSNFDVIPAGRIMFTNAFVLRAVYQEQVKVSQDTRYNPSTRDHYLGLLNLLETAFGSEN